MGVRSIPAYDCAKVRDQDMGRQRGRIWFVTTSDIR